MSNQSNTADNASAQSSSIPALPPNATPEQKDAHWFKHVYAGDKMPQLTLRAVLMGGVLGMLMSAANLYTTLSIGWAFGVAITASVMSFVLWNLLRAISGGGLSKMSLLENNCMASTASAAGYSTGSTLATMFGALLLIQAPDGATKTWEIQPVWLVVLFTLCTGLMGVFLAIPMKRQMINHEQLPFPSGIAAAETLKSLYSESKESVRKAYVLVTGLLVGGIIGLLRTGEGTLQFLDSAFNWVQNTLLFGKMGVRIPEQLPHDGFAKVDSTGAMHWFGTASYTSTTTGKPLIQFAFDPSALLTAAGMIVGLRVSLTMLAGSILLYFFVAPELIALDAANASVADYKKSIELVGGGKIFHVYRWSLWGGTALMVMSSLTALAMQWRSVGRALGGAFSKKAGATNQNAMDAIEVPFRWMIIGMLPITIAMVVLQILAFQIAWWAGIIAVIMSFVLSLVACRATGETDTTPIGAMGKVMQLLFAIFHPGQIVPNLASAGIAANSASSSADLLTDLKSGYLLGANPRRQFLAQFFGCFFGAISSVLCWYALVPDKAALEKFAAPATQMWYKVAQVLTKGLSELPMSAQYAMLIGGAIGVLLPLIEKFLPASAKKYWPSSMGLGLSWVVGFNNSLAFTIGALATWVWSKINPKQQEAYNVPLASGLVAGESLLAALVAMLATLLNLMKWQ